MPVIRENKSGTIESFYDSDTGRIREDGGAPVDFAQEGAQVEFRVGDNVTYLKITLPTGNTIISEIKKPT